jgi:hypothetical protein
MGKPGVLRKTLIWSYERGSLQYDFICGLILAFIFFTPRSCYLKPKATVQPSDSRIITTTGENASPAPAGSAIRK